MPPNVRDWFDLARRLGRYKRRSPLVLMNGLAEQSESWFANRSHLGRNFDLKVPEILVYDGEVLHRHLDGGGEVTVNYLADRLTEYLDEFVQRPPYHLVGSSLGCQVLLTYATRHPERVARMVLICPSGLHGDENLPAMEGVRRSQYDTLVKSVFHSGRFASENLVQAFERKFQDRMWKKGVLKTLRGTVGHSVAHLLEAASQPTLVIWGAQDRVLSDVPGAIRAASRMQQVRQVVVPSCGHAPQIEKAGLVNQLIDRYLRDRLRSIPPDLDPRRFLALSDRAPYGVARAGRHSMSDFSLFLGKFLRQGTAIASLAPSSPWLSRTTVRNVDWSTARVVVELGAGTGPITRVLAERAPESCRLIVVERDPDFAGLLRERFSDRPNMDVVEGDVRDLAAILDDRGIVRADAIISGLPVPSFPLDLTRTLFRVVGKVLAAEGSFNQITELPWVYWRFYRRYFHDVRFAFEPRNLPPAGSYFCRGVKPLD